MKTDAMLKESVLKELSAHPHVIDTHVGVTVRQGVVTLTGHVSTFAEKNGAEEAAKIVGGVRAIANELLVDSTPNNFLSDEAIASQCIRSLKSNSRVPLERIHVIVQDRWVTLEGYVDFESERLAVYESVNHIRGVDGVTNSIRLNTEATSSSDKDRIDHSISVVPDESSSKELCS